MVQLGWKAKLWTLPSELIPVYISSLVPESAGFAGEPGDGLITTGGEKPEHYKELLKRFYDGAWKATAKTYCRHCEEAEEPDTPLRSRHSRIPVQRAQHMHAVPLLAWFHVFVP